MSKSKRSAEFRAKVSQEYLDGKGSAYYLANKYHIGKTTIQRWVAAYKDNANRDIKDYNPKRGGLYGRSKA